jgi:hypothetical protein
MQELIEKLKTEHGLSQDQSENILVTVKNFIKEKFPMMAGTLDNLFPAKETTHTAAGDTGSTSGPADKGGSFMDKISDVIPGEMGEKAEKFAKDKLGNIL